MIRPTLDSILLQDLQLSRWLGRNRKKWLRQWARSERERDMLSDLIARGYELNWPPPIAGGARNFDAVDDRISRPGDDAALDCADSSSVALQCLAKLDAVSTVIRTLCGKKNTNASGNAGYLLNMTSAEVVRFNVSDATDQVVVGTGAVTAGTWYGHTGFVTANAAANDDMSYYRDGTLNAGPTNSTVLGTLANAVSFRAGCNGNNTEFWDGDIAYVRTWIKAAAAWTAQERLLIVEAHNKLYLPQDALMELQWILWDAGSPTTANDYTDNSFDGTYTGTTFVEDPKRVMKASSPSNYFFKSAPVAVTGWEQLLSDRRNRLVVP